MKKKNNIKVFFAVFFLIVQSCSPPKKAIQALQLAPNSAKIIYVYDPLCGWCYAFKSVMQAFKQNHENEIDFEILSGGMIIGEPKDSIGKLKEFFSESIPMLESETGTQFGDGFKKSLHQNGSALFSSEKPAIALTAYKNMAKKNSTKADPFAFAHSIQVAIYSDGLPPEENTTYINLAQQAGMDPEEFNRQLQDTSTYKKTWREFAICQGLKANGYPTVFLLKANGSLIKLTDGYTSLTALEASYQKNK
jgi:putative protein-disulfide isomerase